MKYSNNSGPRLTCELVPQSTHYKNLRSELTSSQWDHIRKNSYRLAAYVCEICGDTGLNQGRKHPVECHEIWEIDDLKLVQTLKGVISLCPQCHQVKHAGLASVNNKMHEVLTQLCSVNDWDINQAMIHVNQAFERFHSTKHITYTIDMSYAHQKLLMGYEPKASMS